MLVLCLCRVRQRDFTQLHALSVSMCMPTCTRYVCGSAGTSRQRGTSTHYMHAAARHFHALCACGSAGTFTHCMYAAAWALSRTVCMRQRGTFTHYMHAAARALSLFHSQGSAAAPGHVGDDGLPDCTRVRVCSSLLEFAFEFVLSWAVRVLRNRVNRVSRCARRCVSRCASRCVDFSQPHAFTRPRARRRWWRWFFSLFICRWWRVGDELARW